MQLCVLGRLLAVIVRRRGRCQHSGVTELLLVHGLVIGRLLGGWNNELLPIQCIR